MKKTVNVPIGDYVIQNGANITLKGQKSVTLSPGFSVERGATFKIEIQP